MLAFKSKLEHGADHVERPNKVSQPMENITCILSDTTQLSRRAE